MASLIGEMVLLHEDIQTLLVARYTPMPAQHTLLYELYALYLNSCTQRSSILRSIRVVAVEIRKVPL